MNAHEEAVIKFFFMLLRVDDIPPALVEKSRDIKDNSFYIITVYT